MCASTCTLVSYCSLPLGTFCFNFILLPSRMCSALMPVNDETASDRAIWKRLPVSLFLPYLLFVSLLTFSCSCLFMLIATLLSLDARYVTVVNFFLEILMILEPFQMRRWGVI